MKYNLILIIFLISTGCHIKPKAKDLIGYKKIEFKIDGFDWDSKPYKFSTFIKDSVMQNEGDQYAAWNYSYIGDIANMHRSWDSRAGVKAPLTQDKKDSFALFIKRDAIDYILEKAKQHRVMIINEGHHMPQHRVFTTQLLQGLKSIGFKHLGLETYFANAIEDSIFQATGYPSMKSGYYTKEPQFGNMVRIAHAKGYRIFGYESEGHSNAKEREINQAKNIKAYLEKNPNEKILIHCGFDHNLEGSLAGWEKSMAGRLLEYTGIDPLTINQVIYSEKSKIDFENPYYQLTDIDKASVFVDASHKPFGQYRDGTWNDIAIFHSRSKKNKRPVWLIYGDRREVEISLADLEIECPCLVLAYKKGEKIGTAVPYDIQEAKDKKVTLILDKSEFEIVIWNQKNEAVVKELK